MRGLRGRRIRWLVFFSSLFFFVESSKGLSLSVDESCIVTWVYISFWLGELGTGTGTGLKLSG